MRFIRDWPRFASQPLAVLGAVIGLSVMAWSASGVATAYEGPLPIGSEVVSQAQESGEPETNLPFLFAVYIITWAAFFAYAFYISRRQREMQSEIEALKRAIDQRDSQDRLQ